MSAGSRSRCGPTRSTTICELRRAQPGADRRRRGADAAADLHALADARRLRHRAARRHQGRRHLASSAASPGWPTISASSMSATAGTPRSASPPTCRLASALPGRRSGRVHRRQPLCRRHPGRAVHARSGRIAGNSRPAGPRRHDRARQARALHARRRAAVPVSARGAMGHQCGVRRCALSPTAGRAATSTRARGGSHFTTIRPSTPVRAVPSLRR